MLVDGLGPLWLRSISEVNGNPVGRLSEWVGNGQYYFDAPVGPSSVSFVLTPGSSLSNAYAAEMSRFASAAVETSLSITRSVMHKSVSWLLIQTYYAAFYAAHSILRSVGISVTNFKLAECQKADSVATALGFGRSPLDVAQFRCEYWTTGRLECAKAGGKGIHEQFWRIFDGFIQSASSRILKSPSLPALDAQQLLLKLGDLRDTLRFNGHHGGNWLSAIRNEVTYMQQHQAWFPYGRTRAQCDRLFALQTSWRKEPDVIELRPNATADIEVFITGCAFLVALSVSIARDMALRCSSGESFLYRGPLKLLSQTAS